MTSLDFFFKTGSWLLLCQRPPFAGSRGCSSMPCVDFSLRRLLLLQSVGSRAPGLPAVAVHELSSGGDWTYLLRHMWNLPGPGIEPLSPALVCGFLSTVPPGKSLIWLPESSYFRTSCTLLVPSLCVCVCACACRHSVVSDSAIPWTIRLLCPWNFPGKNTGVGRRFLLQGIFPTAR